MTPTERLLLDGIRRVARDQLGYDGPLHPDSSLQEALRLDSMRMLTLVIALEDHFEVCLEQGDEDGIETVGELIAVLGRRLDGR